jgi:hypothetical protein
MKCQAIQETLSGFIDHQLPEEEKQAVETHLAECRHCELRYKQSLHLRDALHALPLAKPSKRLQVQLKIMASRERIRAARVHDLHSRIEYFSWRFKLLIDNLMRPLAVPTAGGLLSAVLLFAALMPSLGFERNLDNDVPIFNYQEATIYSVPDFVPRNRNVDDSLVDIEVEVDSQGRLLNYSVATGQMTGELGNMILFTTYSPAKMFGQPTNGRIILRRSRIVVKG